MKIPKITQLPSGNYFCRLRLNGECIFITEKTYDLCEAKARAIKTGAMEVKKMAPKEKTLRQLIDDYIEDRDKVLSPSTIRGYRIIQRNRFSSIMDKPVASVRNWQRVINDEARICSPKTVYNAWGLVRSVLSEFMEVPNNIKLPQQVAPDTKFLDPDQIAVFVEAVKDDEDIAVPALLALHSLRLSEIKALRWENIPENAKQIRVSGSVVPDEHNIQTFKKQNKTEESTRNVPIMIPELRDALRRDREESGPVLKVHESVFRRRLTKICEENDLPCVTIHGLRHSFASLAYHVNMPTKIAMAIGGWKNEATMSGIYTHVAKSDIDKYTDKMAEFYTNINLKK